MCGACRGQPGPGGDVNVVAEETDDSVRFLLERAVRAGEELFIVSKLFQTHHVWEGDDSRCTETLLKTLADLRIDYLDLFLIHWPFAFAEKVLENVIKLLEEEGDRIGQLQKASSAAEIRAIFGGKGYAATGDDGDE